MKPKIFLLLNSLILLFILQPMAQQKELNLTKYVNPFIGTSNGGNTFPGAVVPWGMASVSPHNSPGSPSGYIYGEKYFYGFGHTHLSGTGCSELGNIIVSISGNDELLNPFDYSTSFSQEKASPGYYTLYLDNYKIQAEVTATERCGIIKFTPEEECSIKLIIDAGKNLSIVGGGEIEILSTSEITGYNISGGFCGEENRKKVYFYSELNYEYGNIEIYENDKKINGNILSTVDTSIICTAELTISPSKPLIITTGISYTSKENAKENLISEIGEMNFESVRSLAESKWENELSKIIVTDTNTTNLTKFYSGLYHMLIHPNIINDVNGDFPKLNSSEIGNYKDRNRYTVYSLWDTYRTLHPFMTFIFPAKQSEMIKTMLDMYDEIGYLPKWPLTGNETYMMVGDPAVPVIVESYVKGIRDFEVNKAYEAILKPVLLKENEKAPPVRAAYDYIIDYGYIPFDQNMKDDWWAWGPVSTTLEYNYADWTISKLAQLLGDTVNQKLFYNRSLGYRHLFDPVTEFIRPKMKNGKWMEPFDPLATEGSGDWEGSGGPGYVEGNAWNYTWFVPHDVNGLIDLFGGEGKFSAKLLESFNNGQFTINNEPDIFYPYLFKYTKEFSHLTASLVNEIISKEFGIDENGLPGNDDCGTISGWFVFSTLGFYPVCPGSEEYVLNQPLFDEVKIQLNQDYYAGKELIIKRKSGKKREVFLNDTQIETNFVKHSDLVKGGELLFIIPDGESE